MHKQFQKRVAWKKLLLVAIAAVCALIGWFAYEIATDTPPNFFPLNDAQAEYRITKNCPQGQGWVEQSQSYGQAYCLEYRGNQVLWKAEHHNTNFFSITIGQSPINLEAYLGQPVKNIQGKYTSSGKQCIQNQCLDIGGPYVVVNIDSLELAK